MSPAWLRWIRLAALAAAAVTLVVALAISGGRVRFLAANTLLVALGTCAGSVPLGTLLALLLFKTELPGRRAALVVLGVLLFVPLYLVAAAWEAGFGLQGWYTLAFRQPPAVAEAPSMPGAALTVATAPPPLLDGWRGAIWIHSVAAIPWVVLIVGAGLLAVEPELEHEALLDGSPLQVFRRVTLRRALPLVLVSALWVGVAAAGEITVTDLYQIRTYAEEVYAPYKFDQPPVTFWAGTLLTGLLVTSAIVALAGLAPQMETLSFRSPWRMRLGHWRGATAAATWAVLGILAAVPLGSLVYKAGVVVTQEATGRVRTWSLAKCLAIVAESPGLYKREFTWSPTIALCASATAVGIGLALAMLARKGVPGRVAALVIAAVAFALPGSVLGVLLIRLINQPGSPLLRYLYDKSILTPWLAQTIRGLPLPILILWHALGSVSAGMLDSARLEGAGRLSRIWRMILPNRWPAVVVAGLVAFVVALGELSATILVSPPPMPTLPVTIFNLMHYGVEDNVAGICLALVGLTALVGATLVIGGFLLARRARRP